MADIIGKFYSSRVIRRGVSPSNPGNIDGEEPVPVNPPAGNPTFGVGAGLSLDSVNRIQLGKQDSDSIFYVDLQEYSATDPSNNSLFLMTNWDNYWNGTSPLYSGLTVEKYASGLIANDSGFISALAASTNSEALAVVQTSKSGEGSSINFRTESDGVSIYLSKQIFSTPPTITEQSILFDKVNNLITIKDEINSKGLEYASDYESNFTARSLVTKQYVDGAVSGATISIGSPANGLSLAGTVLSLGLASSGVTGALSGADWNTFNGKIGGSIGLNQIPYTISSNTVEGTNDFLYQKSFNRLLINQNIANNQLSLSVRSNLIEFKSSTLGLGGGTGVEFDLTSNNPRLTYYIAGVESGQISYASSIFRIRSITNNTGAIQFTTFTSGAENIRLFINNSGSVGILNSSPTNTLDVNGTARIRTISNLGSTATRFLVASATGVISERTGAELASDIGATNFWTLNGSGITRNSQVGIGTTLLGPSNATLRLHSLGTGTGNFPLVVYDFNSVLCAAISKEGFIGSGNITPTTNFESTRNTADSSASIVVRQTNAAGTSAINLINSASKVGYVGVTSPSFTSSLGNFMLVGLVSTGTDILIAPNLSNTGSTTEKTIFRNGGFSATFDIAYFDINGLVFSESKNIAFGTTTGTKIGTATSQRLAFWNKTPIVQPTNAIAGATRVGGGGTNLTDTDTFGGYTVAQIAQALINVGLLA